MIHIGIHAISLCYTAGKTYLSSQLGQVVFTRFRVSTMKNNPAISEALYTRIYDKVCKKELSQNVCRLLKAPCFETCVERVFNFRNETFGVVDVALETAEQLERKWIESGAALANEYVAEDFFQRAICFDACKASYHPMLNLPFEESISGIVSKELFIADVAEHIFEKIAEIAFRKFFDKNTALRYAQAVGVGIGIFAFYKLTPASSALSLVETVMTYGAVKIADAAIDLTLGFPVGLFLSFLKKRA